MMLIVYSVYLLSIGLGTSAGEENYPTVETPLGKIKGYYEISERNTTYESYVGIPYALPPVGKLRFEEPQRITPWIGELPATGYGHRCLQYPKSRASDPVRGDEDCLYLNIYAPKRNSTLMPVLVWIHGGGFQFGSGDYANNKYLADYGIILASFNYRVGMFGFLSTEDCTVPGNMGLKDQSMALRWLYENIRYFGGDPKKITIIGGSAGAMSVHYHYLSTRSFGLFRAGLSMGGTALVPSALSKRPLEKAKKLGAIMGCPTNNVTDMIECLRDRPALNLARASSQFFGWRYNPFGPFGPVAEKCNRSAFIDKPPHELIKNGQVQDVPWIAGVVEADGLARVGDFITNNTVMEELDSNWESIAPYLLEFNDTVPVSQHAAYARTIREHYLGSKRIGEETKRDLIKMVSDGIYKVPSEQAAREHANVTKSPVRFYYFTYRGAHSGSEAITQSTENFGSCHLDDLTYVMQTSVDTSSTPQDRQMQQLMQDFWASYVINGTPSVGTEWPRYDPLQREFFHLRIGDPNNVTLESNENFGDKDFWNTLDFNENSG